MQTRPDTETALHTYTGKFVDGRDRRAGDRHCGGVVRDRCDVSGIGDIVRELRDDYPAVDVTTVVFSTDFAGVGCCVIPQERVLAIAGNIDALVTALTSARAAIASLPMEALGYASAENDQAHWPIRDELLHNVDEAIAKASAS